ncbi:proline--tRNA ligase [Candidatus Woesearchaeota archaeon]|nr:proline--tRNA ligase [Candidatus Woesearchaeota archaeon]
MTDKKGSKANKQDNFSEWYSQICGETGAKLVDLRYDVQGFIVHRPWSMRVLRKIYSFFEEEVEKDNHEPMLFPTVIPEEHLLKEKEHAGFTPEVFWVEYAGDKKLEKRLALRPTGETQIYPLYSLWIRSYNDLPLKGYQSRITTFRNEMTTRPFLRGREFMFFETHDVFETHDEAVSQIKKDLIMMKNTIRDKLKIPFLFFQRPKWDVFKGADETFTSDSILPDGKRIQVSSTHDLGHNFAKAFNVQFVGKDGKRSYAFQTCFGPGIWRIFGTMIAIHGDDQGLMLPFCVAPVQVVIIPITFVKDPEASKKVLELSKKLESELKNLNYSVLVDLTNKTPGFKFNEWEMKGVPIRIEIGPRDLEQNQVTVSARTSKEKLAVKINELKNKLPELAEQNDKVLEETAIKYFKDNIKNAKTLDEVKSIIKDHRGFVRIPFCSVMLDGKKCAEKLKTETNGVDVCGFLFEKEEKLASSDTCAVCGKKATKIVYAAKSV